MGKEVLGLLVSDTYAATQLLDISGVVAGFQEEGVGGADGGTQATGIS